MGLKTEFLNYLALIKKDAKKSNKELIDKLRRVYYRKIILDTPEFAKKIAAFIAMIFFFMPEVKKADLKHIKIMPLCACCNRIAAERHKAEMKARRR